MNGINDDLYIIFQTDPPKDALLKKQLKFSI